MCFIFFFCAEFYLNGSSSQLSPFHASQISDPREEFKAFHIYILIARWMSVYNWPKGQSAVSELCHKAPVRLPQNSDGKASICICPTQLKAWLANTNQHRTDCSTRVSMKCLYSRQLSSMHSWHNHNSGSGSADGFMFKAFWRGRLKETSRDSAHVPPFVFHFFRFVFLHLLPF